MIILLFYISYDNINSNDIGINHSNSNNIDINNNNNYNQRY